MEHGASAPVWPPFVVVALGAWLAASPLAFEYGDRGLVASDLASGTLLVVLGYLSLSPRGGLARWAVTAVGVWLLFAPLALWAPSAAVYANDTLVGTLAIALSILIPGMPGMRMLPGPATPPGWSYNPSTWPQRALPIALALVSFLLARYLAAFQLEHVGEVWDPFFGEGTERILTSDVSRAFPVSDAGLGAFAYMLEALSGFMGGPQRWRTMPWMVLMFFVLVVPLGIVSIVLVILQPVAVGTFCTVCLATAVLMLAMIPFAVDEVVAMGQFLAAVRREGKPLWTNFWRGGTIDAAPGDDDPAAFPAPLTRVTGWAARGVALPASLAFVVALGLWIMASPWIFGVDRALENGNWVAGALVVTFAVIALADVARPVRFLAIPLAAWVAVAPWLAGDPGLAFSVSNALAGAGVVALTLLRGRVAERYAAWNRYAV